jgi:probable F420-dependent oxidoreductase
MEPTDPILDPLVHLAYVAAVTTRLDLGTGIVILPQRNPVVLAKQVASLDVLSGGRVVLGVGAGHLEPEMAAVGVPMSERGRRTDEYLDAMAALWTQPAPAYRGRFVEFDKVDAHPRPVQPGGPRISVGGHSRAALRRAVTRAHSWFTSNPDPYALAGKLAELRALADEVGRPQRLGELEIIVLVPVSPYRGIDPQLVRRYAELGVGSLLCYPLPIQDAAQVEAALERNADLAG